jgi:hypothetical protein
MVSELYILPLMAVAAFVVPWLVWRRSSPQPGRLPLSVAWVGASIVSVAAGYGALWTATHARALVHGPFWFWLFVAVAAIAQIVAGRAARGELATTTGASVQGPARARSATVAAGPQWLFAVLLAAIASLVVLQLTSATFAVAYVGKPWFPMAPLLALNALPHLAVRVPVRLLALVGAIVAAVYVLRARGRAVLPLACGLGMILGAVRGPGLLRMPGWSALWFYAGGALVGLTAALTLYVSGGFVTAPNRPAEPATVKRGAESVVVRKARRDLAIAAALLVGTAAVGHWWHLPSGFAWPVMLLFWLSWGAIIPAAVFLAVGVRRASAVQLQFARILALTVFGLIAFALSWPQRWVPFVGAMQLFYMTPIGALLLIAVAIAHAQAAQSIRRASVLFPPYARSRGTGLGLSYVVLYYAVLHGLGIRVIHALVVHFRS